VKRNESPRMCKENVYFGIFWLFTALFLINEVLYGITPCRVVNVDRHFEEVFCLRNPDESARCRAPEKVF